ncbi:MAG: hypothetical protein AB1489_28020 [Acidobacteriota bacterium]
MFARIVCLIIVISLGALMTACGGNNASNSVDNSNTSASNQPANPATGNNAEASPDTASPETVAGLPKAPFVRNAPAGDNVTLPSDIPVYPGAQSTGKRITNKIVAFDYKSDATTTAINEFYIKELEKNEWKAQPEQTNSQNGLLFVKPERYVRVVVVDLKEKGRDIHLSVADAKRADEKQADWMGVVEGKPGDPKFVGSVGQFMRFSGTILDEAPVYPNSEAKRAKKLANSREWSSSDSVKQIAEWYDQQWKSRGWQRYNDTSELGDSMITYHRQNQEGIKQYVAVRVNDLKSTRNITVILFPDNAIVPIVKPISVVEAENKRLAAEREKKLAAEKANSK